MTRPFDKDNRQYIDFGRRGIMDSYTMGVYVEEVERIQNGIWIPRRWDLYRKWWRAMPLAKLKSRVNRSKSLYYVRKFGYKRNGDVYEVDNRTVGAICTVVILSWGGVSVAKIAEVTGLGQGRVKEIRNNYKYYVGWHNAYTEDGQRIWPAIREVVLIHKDMTGEEVEEAEKNVIEM